MRLNAVVNIRVPDILTGDLSGHARAVFRAGGDALRALRAEAVRKVRESRAIRAGAVRDAMFLSFPPSGAENPTWRMYVSGRPLKVSAYPYRQTAAGVSVLIKTGSRAVIRHAFVATMPRSGHEGVFMRTGRFNTKPGRRGPVRREIIKELFTTRITDVFKDPGFAEDALGRAMAVFERSYLRNLQIAIEQKVK